MPGPIGPLVSIPVLTTIGDNIAAIFRQQRHPVYNAAGQVVGSYDTLDALCQGAWFLDKGKVQPPASQLYVVDFWGRRVPLSTQCVRAASANAGAQSSIRYPAPVQAASAAIAVAASTKAATGDTTPVTPEDLTATVANQVTLAKVETYALWGGIALLGGMLIFGGERRGRR